MNGILQSANNDYYSGHWCSLPTVFTILGYIMKKQIELNG